MSAWFQLGSAWFLTANIPKHNTFAMVPAWFDLTTNRRVSPNTLCSLASTLKTSWVPAWFFLPLGFEHGSGLVLLGSSSRGMQKHITFAWFLLGSSLVPAWCLWVPHRECNKAQHVCMVPPWFHLAPHRGVSPNTLCSLASTLQIWFQLMISCLSVAAADAATL